MIEPLEEHICRVTDSIWRSVLGLTVRPTSQRPTPRARMIGGSIEITGAWHGTVSVHCSPDLARQAAAVIFGVEPTKATDDQMRDALGELTNMAGGNLKALLPGPSRLLLPAVTESTTRAEPGHGRLVSQVAFECQGEPLLVALVEWEAKA
jgi:chemotaxis protein CheX